MRKIVSAIVLLLMLLTACAGNTFTGDTAEMIEETWQDYYDLGIRYLSEGNYQKAIITFTAAIEIDPKQALAYIGRGDAYVGIASSTESGTQSAKIADNYANAETDYLTALELENENVDIYLKLANLYIAIDDIDAAIAILQQGVEATGSDILSTKLDGLTVSSMQWTANFSLDDEARLDDLLTAFASNDRDTVRLILHSEAFQKMFFEYGVPNKNGYLIDYGNTIDGIGIYLDARDRDDGILWGISGHYGTWKDGLANGDGIEFSIYLNCDSEYYDEQWTTASCAWIEGFAHGSCEVLTTYHGGYDGAYGRYTKRIGEMSGGIWTGTATEISYSNWSGGIPEPKETTSEIIFENGRERRGENLWFKDITTHKDIRDVSDTKVASLSYLNVEEPEK